MGRRVRELRVPFKQREIVRLNAQIERSFARGDRNFPGYLGKLSKDWYSTIARTILAAITFFFDLETESPFHNYYSFARFCRCRTEIERTRAIAKPGKKSALFNERTRRFRSNGRLISSSRTRVALASEFEKYNFSAGLSCHKKSSISEYAYPGEASNRRRTCGSPFYRSNLIGCY